MLILFKYLFNLHILFFLTAFNVLIFGPSSPTFITKALLYGSIFKTLLQNFVCFLLMLSLLYTFQLTLDTFSYKQVF